MIEKLYFMPGRLVTERSCAVQRSYCAGCRVLVCEGWWWQFMNHNVWILVSVDFVSVVLPGLLAHISVIVFWRVEASFPSPAAVHIYLLCIFLSVTPPVSQNISISLPRFTSESLIYVCQARCSLCQKPKGQVRFNSLWERKKKNCVFSSAAALEGQRWLCANTSVPYRPLWWGTFSLHTSANRCKNTSPPPPPLSAQNIQITHWITSRTQKRE